MEPNVSKLVREAVICSLVAGCLCALDAAGKAFGSSAFSAVSFGLGFGFAAGINVVTGGYVVSPQSGFFGIGTKTLRARIWAFASGASWL